MWNGSESLVRGFVDATGISFPILMQAGYLQGPSFYSIRYDNYVVIDAQGIVRYTSVGEPFTSVGPFQDAKIRQAIAQFLPTAVESRTWSGVKALYRRGGAGLTGSRAGR